MKNLLSYCGLVVARRSASEKDLPVRIGTSFGIMSPPWVDIRWSLDIKLSWYIKRSFDLDMWGLVIGLKPFILLWQKSNFTFFKRTCNLDQSVGNLQVCKLVSLEFAPSNGKEISHLLIAKKILIFRWIPFAISTLVMAMLVVEFSREGYKIHMKFW